MPKSQLGNVAMDVVSGAEGLASLQQSLVNRKKTAVYFLNAHCYNIAQKDEEYRNVINMADLLLNDGVGIKMGARLFGVQLKENLNGTDFIPELLQLAAEKGFTAYLLGAGPGVAGKAAEHLQRAIPGLRIVGYRSGYFSKEENDAVVHEINRLKPDILIVGRGVPIQEKWISDNKESLNATIILGVGAYIDFASGRIPRAPQIIRKLRLEWVYRLLLEPKRMWRRYLVGNFQFFYYVIKNKNLFNRKAEVQGP
ncbi:WecB/TagA/CpsF family glycosyltransferase [Gracilibacillus sp. Marseille-QA3620]